MPPPITMEALPGLNPHYRPPVMRWKRIEVIAAEGFEFGILLDDAGDLSIVAKPPGGDWPDGYTPRAADIIRPGERSWQVFNDERGPAVDHDFQHDPTDPSRCVMCDLDAPIIVTA